MLTVRESPRETAGERIYDAWKLKTRAAFRYYCTALGSDTAKDVTSIIHKSIMQNAVNTIQLFGICEANLAVKYSLLCTITYTSSLYSWHAFIVHTVTMIKELKDHKKYNVGFLIYLYIFIGFRVDPL